MIKARLLRDYCAQIFAQPKGQTGVMSSTVALCASIETEIQGN